VITQTLNLYTATFVADGCEAMVFQQLNLRWLGACRFEFEHDPDARIVARGPYGETVIAVGHYPAGELELNKSPCRHHGSCGDHDLHRRAGACFDGERRVLFP